MKKATYFVAAATVVGVLAAKRRLCRQRTAGPSVVRDDNGVSRTCGVSLEIGGKHAIRLF